jgi:hypothetical protein
VRPAGSAGSQAGAGGASRAPRPPAADAGLLVLPAWASPSRAIGVSRSVAMLGEWRPRCGSERRPLAVLEPEDGARVGAECASIPPAPPPSRPSRPCQPPPLAAL